MNVKKIIKNISGNSYQILNRQIDNNSSYDIPTHLWLELADDISISDAVSSSLLIVNDGIIDLSIEQALVHLKRFQFDTADKIAFNNTTNGFLSTTTQQAIEEIKTTIIPSLSRFSIITFFNGTIGNNQWLGYSELLPGNTTPIVIPINCTLKEITFSWNSTISLVGGLITITGNVDGRFDLYKNGTSSGDIVFSRTFTNSGAGGVSTDINVNFNSGDIIIGRWVDQGDNPSDAAICYYLQPR